MKHEYALYVAGKNGTMSRKIIACVTEYLKKRLGNGFKLNIIDVIDNPETALKEGILVTPSWVRTSPAPKKKIVGNFCLEANVSRGLDILSS